MNNFNIADKLISILSTIGEVSLNKSYRNNIYNLLDNLDSENSIGSNEKDTLIWLNTLEDLEYIKIDYSKNRIFSIKPHLCKSATNGNEFFVCGVRDAKFIKTLESWCERNKMVFICDHQSALFPLRISICGNIDTNLSLDDIILDIPILPKAYLLAYRELKLLDVIQTGTNYTFRSLKDLIPILKEKYAMPLGQYFLKKDETRLFYNLKTLKFDINSVNIDFGLSKRNNSYETRYELVFYDKNKSDYYFVQINDPRFGKYILLSEEKYKIIYNKTTNQILIPKYCPLPKCYSKALALCSFTPPIEKKLRIDSLFVLGGDNSETPFLLYMKVPEVIAKIVCNQLGMEIEYLK